MSKHREVMADPFGTSDAALEEAPDPMSGLTNLADCMLVLACGLMVALVVHWNLNTTPRYEVVEETENLVDVGEAPEYAVSTQNDEESLEGEENVYENMGTLYRDTSTGKMYYLRGAEGGAEGGAGDAGE